MSSLIGNAAPDNPKDRRVSRTRRLLSEALFELLQHRPWEKITVQEIIDAADVGRVAIATERSRPIAPVRAASVPGPVPTSSVGPASPIA